jgi:hypothetical protein
MVQFLMQATSGPATQQVIQTTTKAYEVLLQYGAIGACLVIFIVLFVKILGDNKRLGNLLIERDAAHDRDIMGIHNDYRGRLDASVKSLIEEKDARRSELFKVASDYSSMLNTMRDLGSAVKSLTGPR